MKRSIFYSKYPVAAIAICVVVSMNLQAKDRQVGRYSSLATTPTEAQTELLAATMTLRFPSRIQTVGEAARYLLQRSGYRLANVESIGPDTVALFALPLPAVHRSLGPMTLRDALQMLAGSSFYLVQDPVHRLVTFERCVAQKMAVQDSGTSIDMEVVQDDD